MSRDKVLIAKVTKTQMEGAAVVTGCRCFVEIVDGKHSGYFVERFATSEKRTPGKRTPGYKRPNRGPIIPPHALLQWAGKKVHYAPGTKLPKTAAICEQAIAQPAKRSSLTEIVSKEENEHPYAVSTRISRLIKDGYIRVIE